MPKINIITETETKKRDAAEAILTIPYLIGLDFSAAINQCIDLKQYCLINDMVTTHSVGVINFFVPYNVAINATHFENPALYCKAYFISTNQFTDSIEKILTEKGKYYNGRKC